MPGVDGFPDTSYSMPVFPHQRFKQSAPGNSSRGLFSELIISARSFRSIQLEFFSDRLIAKKSIRTGKYRSDF
jgi:hypothetical protein